MTTMSYCILSFIYFFNCFWSITIYEQPSMNFYVKESSGDYESFQRGILYFL